MFVQLTQLVFRQSLAKSIHISSAFFKYYSIFLSVALKLVYRVVNVIEHRRSNQINGFCWLHSKQAQPLRHSVELFNAPCKENGILFGFKCIIKAGKIPKQPLSQGCRD